jgi:hypothetical protein
MECKYSSVSYKEISVLHCFIIIIIIIIFMGILLVRVGGILWGAGTDISLLTNVGTLTQKDWSVGWNMAMFSRLLA